MLPLLLVLIVAVFLPPMHMATTVEAEAGNGTDTERVAPSSLYCVQLECATPVIRESDEELARRLALIASDALSAANVLHLRQKVNFTQTFTDRSANDDIRVEIMRRLVLANRTILSFVTYLHDEPIPGDVLGEDLKLLSAPHISAVLQYPISRIVAQKDAKRMGLSSWLTIAVITGSGLLILCFGWCLLFIYFNSCGARRIYQEISKIVYQKDDTTQYESPVLPSKGIREEVYGESLDASDTKFVDLKQKSPSTSRKSPAAATQNYDEPSQDGKMSTESKHPAKVESLHRPDNSDERAPDDTLSPAKSQAAVPRKESRSKNIKKRPSPSGRTSDYPIVRPRAAATTRPVRSQHGDSFLNGKETGWTQNYTDDLASAMYSIRSISSNHPRPAHPTNSGEVELKENSMVQNSLEVL